MLSRKKRHLPYLWSPIDMKLKTGDEPPLKRPCIQLRRCGISLDKYGYLPCSLSIMIVRLLGLTDLYKYEIPTEPWGLDLVCKHCILSMDRPWCKKNAKLLKNITEEEKTPSKTFKEAMEKFNIEQFYKTQREF
jgi:hypothetical protein